MADLSSWSATPTLNDLAGYFQTGMRPSSVKTAGWDIMADLKQALFSLPQAGGTANAQTLAQTRTISAYFLGHLVIAMLPVATNTGAVTLAVDGQAAIACYAGNQPCVGGEMVLGVPAMLKYDTAINAGAGGYHILNPQRGAAFGVGSGTNAITATVPGLALVDGKEVLIKHANTSTGNTTLALNGGAALNVYIDPAGTVRDPGGMTVQNGIGKYVYNSSFNAGAGGWQLINPERIVGSATVTSASINGSPTATLSYRVTADLSTATLVFGAGLAGTSNSVNFNITGLPSFLAPALTQSFLASAEDNTVACQTCVNFTASSTTISLGKGTTLGQTGGWTGANTKAFANGAIPGTAATFTITLP